MDDRLVARLYTLAKGERWRAPRDHFAAALEQSAERAFAGTHASARDIERYLTSLHLEDLAHASACAAGDEEAWGHFVLEDRPLLYRAADALDSGGGARGLADTLYAELFGLPGAENRDPARPAARLPLFQDFHGRSRLAAWLWAVLAQRFVDQDRTARRSGFPPDGPATVPPTSENDRSEPDGDRFAIVLRKALAGAVAVLAPRDRLRLACHYSQGLTLVLTGRLLGEDEATVSRHLARTRAVIREDVEQRLSRDEGLTPTDIAACFASFPETAGPLEPLLRQSGSAPTGAVTTDSCIEPEALAAWADGRLSGDALELTQTHLADCPRCQMTMGSFLRVDAELSTGAAVGLPRRKRTWFAPLAVTAVVVLGVSGWFLARSRLAISSAPPSPASVAQPVAPSGADAPLPPAPPPDTASAGALESPAVAPPMADKPAAAPATVVADPLPVVIEVNASGERVRWRISADLVERSMDGGTTWQAMAIGVTAALTAGAAPAPSVCWVVGKGGVVLVSTDAVSWRRAAFPEPVDLVAVRAIDARTATVTASDGRVFRTTDSGNSWSRP